MSVQIVFNNDTPELAYVTCLYLETGQPDKTVIHPGKLAQRPSTGTVYIRWSHSGNLPDPIGDPDEKQVCRVLQSDVDVDFTLSKHGDCEWR